jgi:hypothetical protein
VRGLELKVCSSSYTRIRKASSSAYFLCSNVKVLDGVADCCDCSDEEPTGGATAGGSRFPSCVNTCEADAWARVQTLRASAEDEASGALVRLSVLAPAGQALHASVSQALPGLEAQAAGYLKRFQDMQVAAARDPQQGRSYQAMMAIRSAQQQAQQAANQVHTWGCLGANIEY